MKHGVMLTIACLLSILLMTFHLTDDIVRGFEKGGVSNLVAVRTGEARLNVLPPASRAFENKKLLIPALKSRATFKRPLLGRKLGVIGSTQ